MKESSEGMKKEFIDFHFKNLEGTQQRLFIR